MREMNHGYLRELGRLRQAQAQERQTLAQEQSLQSQELARVIREGRDQEQFRKEQGLSAAEEFERRVKARAEAVKKRREEERRRDRDGGRERE